MTRGRLALVSLAPSHPIVAERLPIASIDFHSKDVDRLANRVREQETRERVRATESEENG